MKIPFIRKHFELKFVAVEFNPEKIKEHTEILNKLLLDGWECDITYQTENGIIKELYRKKSISFSF